MHLLTLTLYTLPLVTDIVWGKKSDNGKGCLYVYIQALKRNG